jgi:hypothetical protein
MEKILFVSEVVTIGELIPRFIKSHKIEKPFEIIYGQKFVWVLQT